MRQNGRPKTVDMIYDGVSGSYVLKQGGLRRPSGDTVRLIALVAGAIAAPHVAPLLVGWAAKHGVLKAMLAKGAGYGMMG